MKMPSHTINTPHFINEATDFAAQTFQSHITCVLKQTILSCLHRLLRQRVRNYMLHHVPPEQIFNNTLSIQEILTTHLRHQNDNDKICNPLAITEQDVQYCRTVATRLGNKWAQVLLRQGYETLAEVALAVVRADNYLELPNSPPAILCPPSTSVINNGNTNTTNVDGARERDPQLLFVSPYTALHALQRYPLDCNRSGGVPLQYLPVKEDQNYYSRDEKIIIESDRKVMNEVLIPSQSARKVIEQIDTMAKNGMTYWNYGWDAIEEAVQRNRQRIDYSRMSSGSLSANASGSIAAKGHDEDEAKLMDTGMPLLTHDHHHHHHHHHHHPKRKVLEDENGHGEVVTSNKFNNRYCTTQGWASNSDNYDDDNQNDTTNLAQLKRGRIASSIGTEVYNRDDIMKELTVQERKQIIETYIHSPFPYESDMDPENNDCNNTIVVEDSSDIEMHGNPNDGDDERSGTERKGESTITTQPHPHSVVCGALKIIGQIHLWEQTRHRSMKNNNSGGEQNDTKLLPDEKGNEILQQQHHNQKKKKKEEDIQRRRAMSRALKERLGRRVISIAEHRAEYTRLVTCSKVRWSEEGKVYENCKSDYDSSSSSSSSSSRKDDIVGKQSLPANIIRQSKRWLEMDLGECIVEVVGEGGSSTANDEQSCVEKKKCILGFRSLEMALRF